MHLACPGWEVCMWVCILCALNSLSWEWWNVLSTAGRIPIDNFPKKLIRFSLVLHSHSAGHCLKLHCDSAGVSIYNSCRREQQIHTYTYPGQISNILFQQGNFISMMNGVTTALSLSAPKICEGKASLILICTLKKCAFWRGTW